MTKPKKLIEVAMPVKEISAESVRDKSIRHGHISTLHLWWARRPLPVCRAVVFASLVPDPLDENCPQAFKDAVESLLGKNNDLPGDPYRPYDDIPHTVIVDKMEDNLRNRLMMFIGKFSDKYVFNERFGKKTGSKDAIHQFSLITWDSKNDQKIIDRARKLIFVNHNSETGKTAAELLKEFDLLNSAIKKAESDLYNYANRHKETKEVINLEKCKDEAISAFLAKMPKVFDPFAGGGAIPLEAARLGCNSYGNDINPVAHFVQKGSCVFPQKFGKPITYTKEEFVKCYGEQEFEKEQTKGNVLGDRVYISNRLAHDVEFYANKILANVEEEIGDFFPKDRNGNRPIAYYWVRVGKCSNPSCKCEVPLLRQFYLSKKRGSSSSEWKYLHPIISGRDINFEIKNGICNKEGWLKRGNLKCPFCNNVTSVNEIKEQFRRKETGTRLICIISSDKKDKFKIPTQSEIVDIESKNEIYSDRPVEKLPSGYKQAMPIYGWGFKSWGDLFSPRQLKVINTFIDYLSKCQFNFTGEYKSCIEIYLSFFIDKIITRNSTFGRWHILQDTVEHLYGRQAISMVFDYPEPNTFFDFSGGAKRQLEFIKNVIIEESTSSIYSNCINSSSGEKNQFKENEINVVVTDPPYYDAIAYADLSDFFYVWIKRMLGNKFPFILATPQTPKSEECTALKHNHNNDSEKAFQHFEKKLLDIFTSIEFQTKDLVSIMFAHQSTNAWTTLCNSILGSNMNINGSWAIDTEMKGRMTAIGGDALATSVTVACKPSIKSGIGDYREVQKEILQVIKREVKLLYELGFRGADLLTACFGQAVSVFGRYESVEKADGSEVTVAELLEMAREAAFDAIVSDIHTDDITKFYIGWLNLFGFSEAVHDDVRRISQIGLSVDISDIYSQNILVKDVDKGVLGSMAARIKADSKLGLRPVNNFGIDIAQRLMYFYDPKNASRQELLDYISAKAPNAQSTVWRVLNSLAELLPKSKDMKDHELALGLLSNQENLLREAKNREESSGVQSSLDFE